MAGEELSIIMREIKAGAGSNEEREVGMQQWSSTVMTVTFTVVHSTTDPSFIVTAGLIHPMLKKSSGEELGMVHSSSFQVDLPPFINCTDRVDGS